MYRLPTPFVDLPSPHLKLWHPSFATICGCSLMHPDVDQELCNILLVFMCVLHGNSTQVHRIGI